jgi:hypothetical protein
MPYLNCPSCGLEMVMAGPASTWEHCPRCLAQRNRFVELFVSARPHARRAREKAAGPRARQDASA